MQFIFSALLGIKIIFHIGSIFFFLPVFCNRKRFNGISCTPQSFYHLKAAAFNTCFLRKMAGIHTNTALIFHEHTCSFQRRISPETNYDFPSWNRIYHSYLRICPVIIIPVTKSGMCWIHHVNPFAIFHAMKLPNILPVCLYFLL